MTPHEMLSAFRNDGSHEATLLMLLSGIEALKAANTDLQLHFDVAMEDMASASNEADRWHHIATEMAEAIEAYENSTPRYDWNRGLSDALESYNRFSQGS